MARKQQRFIAANYADGELRLVAVTGGPHPDIEAFAAIPISASQAQQGIPRDANVAAEHLRKGLQALGVDAGAVVLGLPADAVTVRMLDIPNVPDTELEAVLEGEVQHFGVTRGFGSRFGFSRIAPGPNSNPNEPQALVMGAEGPTISALNDGAERARLDCEAIEPSLLAGMRVAALQLSGPGPHLLASVSDDMADIALVGDHGVMFYRRVRPAKPVETDNTFFAAVSGTEEASDEMPAFLQAKGPTTLLESMVVEFGRTLDYVRREFGSGLKHLTLTLSSTAQLPLVEALETDLGLEVTLAKAPLSDEGQSILFTHAYGLALRGQSKHLPVFDLRPLDPVQEELNLTRRNLALSMVLSVLLLAAGVGGGFFYGMEANDVERRIASVNAEVREIKAVQIPQAEQRAAQLTQYRLLLGKGLPVPQVMDAVAVSLVPGTTLEGAEINGNQLVLSGEAVDEQSMIRTIELLRTRPGISNVVLNSFDSAAAEGQRKMIKFRLSSQLVAAAQEVTP